MSRIFRTKLFSRWMAKHGIDDAMLAAAVREMESGLIDADLGGSLCKKRICLPGQGKRGGARTIVATKHEGTWFFLYGFNKNERSDISDKEKRAFEEMAKGLLSFTEKEIKQAIQNGNVLEVLP
jgi:hypothetical protein